MCNHVVLLFFICMYLYHLLLFLPSNFFPNLYHPIHSFLPLVRLFFLPSLNLFLYDPFLRPLLSPLFPLSIISFLSPYLPSSSKHPSFLPFFLFFFLPLSVPPYLVLFLTFIPTVIHSFLHHFFIPCFLPSPPFICIIPSFHSPFLFSELA